MLIMVMTALYPLVIAGRNNMLNGIYNSIDSFLSNLECVCEVFISISTYILNIYFRILFIFSLLL